MATIQMKRQAGELRQQAQAKLEELRVTITRQMDGKLEEGETRYTAEELAEKRGEIQALLDQAKEYEDLDSLEGMMKRPADAAPEANRILNTEGQAEDKPQGAFKSIGEFMRAVRTTMGQYDSPVPMTKERRQELTRLYHAATALDRGEKLPVKDLGDLDLKTLVGDDTGSAGRGDFLVPTEHMSELLRVMGEQQVFANRARRVPMSRRTVDFPRLAQTTATDTRPLFSFAAVTKIGEGAQKPEREPTFEQLVLTAIKYAAYLEASDELLSDSIVDMPPVLVGLLTGAIAYEYDRDTIRGSGTAEPQGFIGSAAEYAVNRATANQIGTSDIFEMEARFFGGEGVYLFHPNVIPQIYSLAASNVIAWNRDLASAVPGVLLGRALVRTHKLPLLGTKGDFNLVDPSFYLVGDLQRVTVANSIHYQFRNDVTAWRATFRAAGTPWPAGTFSHEASAGSKTYEVSPFVVLDVPAT